MNRSTHDSKEAVGRRALVAYGDVTKVTTWSGIPYFFHLAGRRTGLFQAGVVLHPERFRRRRLVWNALRPLLLDRPRGFQYSPSHLHALWAGRSVLDGINEYVSHFPLLPPLDVVREPVSFYIDATLRQYLDDYDYGIGKRIRADAVAREREAFLAARFVFCMSRWCADEVTSVHGVPRQRVRVILPGANIDETLIPTPEPWNGSLSPLRLGFIGVEWERKGGPILLDAVTKLRQMGFRSIEVVVVGPDPSVLPAHPAVRAMGFVSKAREPRRFIELVQSFHFGCLLSSAEALGISTLECLRLGIPVIGTAVGGITDTVPLDAGLLLPLEGTSERLAEELAGMMRGPERYARMREAATRIAEHQSWDRTAREMIDLLEQ